MYFAMNGLRNISTMLEYSLTSYLAIFQAALREARQDRILENRLKNVTEKITQLSYDYVCLGRMITFTLPLHVVPLHLCLP